MRPLKFRAWHKEEKKMCPVDTLNLKDGFAFLVGVRTGEDQVDVDARKIVYAPRDGRACKYNEIDLMQFTGLKDKNGKEIYEGDVVMLDDANVVDFADPSPNIRTIRFDEEQAEYGMYWVDGNHQTSGFTVCKKNAAAVFEVIGNIYENPELFTNGVDK